MMSGNAGGPPRFLLAGEEEEAIAVVASTLAVFLGMTIVPSLHTSLASGTWAMVGPAGGHQPLCHIILTACGGGGWWGGGGWQV
jgi:hypothetical protein